METQRISNPTLELFTYSMCSYLTTGLCALVPPVLLSLFLLSTIDKSPNRGRADDRNVLTNALGGHFKDNFGMTGHLFLFTSVREKYIFNPDRQQYVVYQNSTTTGSRSVFVPKTPQIGTYAEDVNSNVGVDIVQARVQNVQGLLYKCNPTVREEPKNIVINFISVNNNLRGELFKLLGLNMTAVKGSNSTKATFFLKVAIKKGVQSTAVLTIPCTVTAAEGNLDINKEDDGFMAMAVDGLRELSLELPSRVLGTKLNVLDIAMEDSISPLGINIVKRYIASTDYLQQWDGLIRALVGAFGLDSEFQNTNTNDEVRKAVEVWVSGTFTYGSLRVFFIWMPIILMVLSRLVIFAYPSVLLSDGLWQVSEWMPRQFTGLEAKEGYNDRKFFLQLNKCDEGHNLEFNTDKDKEMSFGSVRSIRRRITSFEGGRSSAHVQDELE